MSLLQKGQGQTDGHSTFTDAPFTAHHHDDVVYALHRCRELFGRIPMTCQLKRRSTVNQSES